MSKKILVYGAGAIGCVVAARLTLAGHQVTVLARGEKVETLKQKGIHLKDVLGEFQVHPSRIVDTEECIEKQDFIFIATKFNALYEISTQLKRYMHNATIIVPLMNGIPFWYFYGLENNSEHSSINCLDQQGVLNDHFPLEHLIGAVVFITAQSVNGNEVKSDNPYLLIFGEPSHQMTERLHALVELFENTSIEARPVENIRDQIWTKVMANLSSNPLSVVADAPLSKIYSDHNLTRITQQILYEVRAVAACYGARINIDPNTFLKLGSEMGETYTSMWHDYKNHRPLELAPIAEAVFELADAYECPMPTSKLIYELTVYLSEQARTRNNEDEK